MTTLAPSFLICSSLFLQVTRTTIKSWMDSISARLDQGLMSSDFIWVFRKLPFPSHLGKYFIKIGKISAKIHEIGKIKVIFGLGMTPIYGLKNDQIKSLMS